MKMDRRSRWRLHRGRHVLAAVLVAVFIVAGGVRLVTRTVGYQVNCTFCQNPNLEWWEWLWGQCYDEPPPDCGAGS